MKNLTLAIFFLVACYQKIVCAKLNLDNSLPDPVFQKSTEIDADRVSFSGDDWGDLIFKYRRQKNIRLCISVSCQPRSMYHPVCGTDGVTYYNMENLECVMECGADVRIRQMSPCPDYKSTTASPVHCIATSTAVAPTTTSNFWDCISLCPTTHECNSVCDSECARNYGIDVSSLREWLCPKYPSTVATPAPTTPSTPILPTSTVATSTTMSILQKACISSCLVTPEYRPVCGTDGVTYYNHGKLYCAQNCGIDVQLFRRSPCPQKTSTVAIPTSTTPMIPTTTVANSATTSSNLNKIFNEICLSSCTSSIEKRPVCGSDGVTYGNPGNLICAQYCGKDVQLLSWSPCLKTQPTVQAVASSTASPSNVRLCMVSCPTDPQYKPVCGTNNETYFNLSRLKCAIDCGVDVSLLKLAPCHVQVNPNDEENDIDIIKLFLQRSH